MIKKKVNVKVKVNLNQLLIVNTFKFNKLIN